MPNMAIYTDIVMKNYEEEKLLKYIYVIET